MKDIQDNPEIKKAHHMFIIICAVLCFGFGIWGMYSKLDIISSAQGTVVPSSKVKNIQHLEGGIVREIKVKEGDHVEKGQPLVILEGTASGADVGELKIRINSLKADIARLKAEIAGKDKVEFPEDLAKDYPGLIRQARGLFQAHRIRCQSDLARQQEKIKQSQQDIAENRVRLKSSEEGLALLKKQIKISNELLKENLTTEYKHLDLLRDATKLQSNIDEDKIALQRAESSLKGEQEKFNGIGHIFKEKAEQALKDDLQALEEATQRFRKFSDSFKRTIIRSPEQGIVKTLYMVTPGGVIKAGDTIMDIVPLTDKLIVEAHLPIQDVGYVQEGQRAVLQLASRDARRFGHIEGKVAHISPDAIYSPDGKAFYTVQIETEKDRFQRKNLQYELYPGVVVIAFIHTGKRTVFGYLADPFLNTLNQALKER